MRKYTQILRCLMEKFSLVHHVLCYSLIIFHLFLLTRKYYESLLELKAFIFIYMKLNSTHQIIKSNTSSNIVEFNIKHSHSIQNENNNINNNNYLRRWNISHCDIINDPRELNTTNGAAVTDNLRK